MRQPAKSARPRPRKSQPISYPTPSAGLISNRNLAVPQGQAPGAAVLENWFPTPQGARLRRGMVRRASLPGDSPTRSLFTYINGSIEELYAANDVGIWDVTVVQVPYDQIISPADGYIIGPEAGYAIGWRSIDASKNLHPSSNGNWSTIQFTTSGGSYLIGVNGTDDGFIYDGTNFFPYIDGGIWRIQGTITSAFSDGESVTGATSGATATVVRTIGPDIYVRDVTGTFSAGETVDGGDSGHITDILAPAMAAPGVDRDTSDFSFVWAYKERIYFIEKGSMNVHYLPVDQVGGETTLLPLGGVFNRGGNLLFGQTWSLSSGGDGGLSEQCIFVSTEGEVAVYQGISPDTAADWSKVGVYRVGKPLGQRAWIRAGGDIVIATSIGFIPLSKAIDTDYAALGLIAVSNPIADDWRDAVQNRGLDGWHCELWAEGSMSVIGTPTPDDLQPLTFVVNADSGAWCKFTNWQPFGMETFRGKLFMGSVFGRVQEAWVGGSDEGFPYTATAIPLFYDIGTQAQRKIARNARATIRSSAPINPRVTAKFDWDTDLPPAPSAAPISDGNEWNNAIWDQSIWNASPGAFVWQNWVSVGGSGYAATVAVQVTSSNLIPLDAELVRLDLTVETADVIS